MAPRTGSRLAPKTKAAAHAAGRDQRKDRDAYLTPRECSLAICKTLRDDLLLTPATIIEPSAGDGSFVAACRTVWPTARVMAVDIQNGHGQALHRSGATSYIIGDWLTQKPADLVKPSLIIGNPPYSHAEEHIAHALTFLGPHARLAFLLPMSFLCGQGRVRRLWSQKRLEYLIPLAQRPSFTGNGSTDMTEYGVYVFAGTEVPVGASIRPHLWWREQ